MSDTPKHTPGPWHIDLDYIIAACQFDADGYAHGHIAQVTQSFYGDYDADLRLIAAAPELLEALKIGRRAIGEHNAPSDCYATGPLTGNHFADLVQCPACLFIHMYDAAVAKAEGRQG